MSFNYPDVRRDDSIVDTFFDTEVKDPYRWLEDPDAEETKQFVSLQNKITFPYLEKCESREKINTRLTELFDFPKYGCPSKHGSKYFFRMNTGLQNQSVIYVQDTLESEPRVFFDPNTLSDDGTVAIHTQAWSENGKYFAYGLSESGSDWFNIKFIDIETNTALPDVILKAKFSSIEWTDDEKGVFYCRYPNTTVNKDGTETLMNENKMVYYHRLGTNQSEDVKCIAFPDHPKWNPYSQVSDCGKYLVTSVNIGCSHTVCLYVTNLENGIQANLPLIPIFENQEEDSDYEYVTNEGSMFTFRTNSQASNWKLVNIDIHNVQKENWTTLIPENEKLVLEWASCFNHNILVICYMKDVSHVLQLHKLEDGEYVSTLPLDIGTVISATGKKKSSELFYYFTSFTTPGIIYHCDLATVPVQPKIHRQIEMSNFDASAFVTKQVFFTSKDGTSVPMFLIHSKDLKLDGSNPCILYGYGGFDISISPSFAVNRLVLIDNLKGIYAVANIRGGGEYGKKWHDGGILLNKQNVFDDFISAAEYLCDKNYTCKEKLIIQGGSNGGLLVGACINQRPDLFACGIAHVGVMDMLRFHKFTIGHAWCTDYGSADEEKYFDYIYRYSPLHNIRVPPGDTTQYPALLLLTADHDDRVVPLHSLKFTAEIQHTLGSVAKQMNPLMIRIDTEAGHGAGKPTTKVIKEYTDIYCFIINALNLKYQHH